MTKPDLRCVTLVCFENQDHASAISLIYHMIELCDFGDVRLANLHHDYPGFIAAECTVHETVRTTHMMFCHLDGYVLRPDLWNPEWLNYDYIGAPWPRWIVQKTNHGDYFRVGNGGFSIRTVKLARAAESIGFKLNNGRDDNITNNDVQICRDMRPRLEQQGFRWAPISEAAKFSTELQCPETQPDSFGFHKYHWPKWRA